MEETIIDKTRAIILAAGRSTRFKTDKSKLLYSICGQPMILYPIRMLQELKIPITLVVGYCADEIKEEIKKANIKNIDYVTQKEQLGTGHAIAISKETWDKENILIINGDAPLLTKELIENLISAHHNKKSIITFLSAHCLNPYGYGRVIREGGKISIVEEKNCAEEQSYNTLINAGVYLISKEYLQENIDKVKKDPISGEIYITTLISMANEEGLNVHTIPVPYDNVRGINNMEELWAAEQIKRSEIIKGWMNKGVRFELAQNIHIDYDAEIGSGSFIGTGVHLLNGTKIGKNCTINAFSIIERTIVDDNSHIHSHSVVQDSKIGKNVHVGPFARLRNNAILNDNVNIGNFVEVKNSQIDENSKAKHLTFLGDAIVGKKVNIGAGTITCNYDGKEKHQTIIEDNCFIGSNNTLIAPLKIEKDSYTAGGSTISKNVPSGSLAFGRARQEIKKDYFKNKKDNNKDNKKSEPSPKKNNNTGENNLKLNFLGAVKTDDIQEL
jgi:bifunctional UDP-N-acetylglucosamine pyrophosphorylase / glucosamine-1-phosphate N-acetyltransferase